MELRIESICGLKSQKWVHYSYKIIYHTVIRLIECFWYLLFQYPEKYVYTGDKNLEIMYLSSTAFRDVKKQLSGDPDQNLNNIHF